METFVMPDSGPIYTETNLANFIVEPFNTLTALLFVGMSCYWFIKLRGEFKQHKFLTICLLLLSVGGVGGSIYHAFRVSAWFMYMDWLPILVLCVLTGLYFVFRLTASWLKAIGMVCLALSFEAFTYQTFAEHNIINFNYAVMAAIVLLPTLFLLKRIKFYQSHLVALAFVCFSVALTFRIFDKEELLPVGTHFLWHLFGALAAHFMFLFIYRLRHFLVQLHP